MRCEIIFHTVLSVQDFDGTEMISIDPFSEFSKRFPVDVKNIDELTKAVDEAVKKVESYDNGIAYSTNVYVPRSERKIRGFDANKHLFRRYVRLEKVRKTS